MFNQVVLCCAATHDGGLLARRLRAYPSLAACTTAVALPGWDQQACDAVARVTWAGLDQARVGAATQQAALAACAAMHQIAAAAVSAAAAAPGGVPASAGASPSLCLPLCLPHCVSHFDSHCVSLAVSLSLCLPLCLPQPCLPLCFPHCVFLTVSPSPSLSLAPRTVLSHCAGAADFLELLRCVRGLLLGKRHAVQEKANNYVKGVEQMKTLQAKVGEMQESLEQLRPVLKKTQVETEGLVKEVEAQKAAADATREGIEEEKGTAVAEAAEAKRMRDICNKELAATMPPLNEAIAQMRQISKRDIAELKSMNRPPVGIRRVMECVAVLLGRRPTLPGEASEDQINQVGLTGLRCLMPIPRNPAN
jgi:hypothetical protein